MELLSVGQRVTTYSQAEQDQFEHVRETRIAPEDWRVFTVRQDQRGDGIIEADLLRPADWLNGSEVGDTVQIDLEELGLAGDAELVAIAPCPAILSGPGRLVVSVFRHSRGDVGTLYLKNSSAPDVGGGLKVQRLAGETAGRSSVIALERRTDTFRATAERCLPRTRLSRIPGG